MMVSCLEGWGPAEDMSLLVPTSWLPERIPSNFSWQINRIFSFYNEIILLLSCQEHSPLYWSQNYVWVSPTSFSVEDPPSVSWWRWRWQWSWRWWRWQWRRRSQRCCWGRWASWRGHRVDTLMSHHSTCHLQKRKVIVDVNIYLLCVCVFNPTHQQYQHLHWVHKY